MLADTERCSLLGDKGTLFAASSFSTSDPSACLGVMDGVSSPLFVFLRDEFGLCEGRALVLPNIRPLMVVLIKSEGWSFNELLALTEVSSRVARWMDNILPVAVK